MRSHRSIPTGDGPVVERFGDPRRQGDAGVGLAIAWYTARGFVVSIPLSDSQPYDLVVDDGLQRLRVWVRTTTLCGPDPGRHHQLNLRTVSGLGKGLGMGKVRKFSTTAVDELFVACGDGRLFRIPSDVVRATSGLSLGPKWKRFEVSWQSATSDSARISESG